MKIEQMNGQPKLLIDADELEVRCERLIDHFNSVLNRLANSDQDTVTLNFYDLAAFISMTKKVQEMLLSYQREAKEQGWDMTDEPDPVAFMIKESYVSGFKQGWGDCIESATNRQ